MDVKVLYSLPWREARDYGRFTTHLNQHHLEGMEFHPEPARFPTGENPP